MKRAVLVLLLIGCVAFAAISSAEEMATLSYNSKGDAVIALQERLTALGYYTFRITGVYQENTQKAVRLFQEAHGLPVTGVADAGVQSLILSEFAMPINAPTPTLPPEALYVDFPGQLSYGDTGEDVKRLQTRLTQLGYYQIEISGKFLGNTRNAVRDFQRQNGLAADGVVGELTWETLFFDSTVADASATPKPTPEPTPVPYYVEVNVTNQVTTVYGLDEEGDYSLIVRQMLCSTGTEKDPTPLKTYVLSGATSRWCYFPKWGSHAQYWTRMDASNAFHSVIYTEPNEMALSVGSYKGLGKRASHGCIRLLVHDAKWIYDNCGKGTEVLVYEGEPDEELTKALKVPPLDYSSMLPKPTAEPTPPPEYDAEALPPMPFTTLQRGTESEAVYWLQCKLKELGYYQGSITSGYYSGTVSAVKAFQKDNGLTVDGTAGKKTLSKLYEDVLATPEPATEPAVEPTATPTPTQSVVPWVTIPPQQSPTVSPGVQSTVAPQTTWLETGSPKGDG